MAKYRLFCKDCNRDFYSDEKVFSHSCEDKEGKTLEREAKLSPEPDVWRCYKGHELHTDKRLKSVGYYCLDCREEGKPFENMINRELQKILRETNHPECKSLE